jgi:hypothetical protein
VDLPIPSSETDLNPQSIDRQGAEKGTLVESAAAVRAAYEAGALSSLEAHAMLARRYLVDRSGAFWSVGVCSGGWYRFVEDAWQRAGGPPDPASLVRLQPSPAACPACGQPTEGAGSCPNCGAALPSDLVGLSDQAYGAVARFMLEHVGSLPELVAPPWEPPLVYPNAEVPRVMRQVPAEISHPSARVTSASDEWRLRWTYGPQAGQQVALGERVRLGRESDNDICIERPGISRHHAVIERVGSGYQITDLGSANGTRVNGQPISAPTPLHDGDQVTMHDVQFRVVAPSPPRVACPACGTPLSRQAKFCGHCGARVNG